MLYVASLLAAFALMSPLGEIFFILAMLLGAPWSIIASSDCRAQAALSACVSFEFWYDAKERKSAVGGVDERTVLPPKNAEDLVRVEELLRASVGAIELVGPDGRHVALPSEVGDALTQVVTALRHGQAITVAPHSMRLTTQEAADLLGVSRPTLVKMLEDGKIPFETPNRHRRIRLSDLLTFQAMRRDERRSVLRELTQEAQTIGTYDEASERYEAALKDERAKLA